MPDHFTELLQSVLYIVPGGILVTLEYTTLAVSFGLMIGVTLSLFKLSSSKFLNYLANIYVSLFRGTPVLVQLSLVYFALPSLTGLPMSVYTAGVLAFSLNSGAYVAEIIRAGVQSVDKGQFEAALSLGTPKLQMMKDVIFPQALKNVLPALVNEFVNVLKETAIIATIGGADLMRRAQLVAAEQYSYFTPLLIAAGCYYVLVVTLSALANQLEKKLKAHDTH